METLRYELAADGILTITFDAPNDAVNTMTLAWQRDLAGAESLVELDELIDRANRRFVERLVDVMAEPSLREWGLHMVVVARTIERIGDRAVDIGEQTAYLLTAEFREFTDASHPTRS